MRSKAEWLQAWLINLSYGSSQYHSRKRMDQIETLSRSKIHLLTQMVLTSFWQQQGGHSKTKNVRRQVILFGVRRQSEAATALWLPLEFS